MLHRNQGIDGARRPDRFLELDGKDGRSQVSQARRMRIADVYRDRRFGLSIEIYPPKTADGDAGLRQTLEELVSYRPAFFSCTYGAGGSTSKRTIQWCQEIRDRFGFPATAHLTCVGSRREELCDWLAEAETAGVANIMALRGDPPAGETSFKAVDGGLTYACDLVKLIRERNLSFGIGVAGYPEKHPEAPSFDTDLAHLKSKVDAGADAIYTQLFFDNEKFLRFRDACIRAGITIPVVPGLMPITEFARIQRITSMCGAAMPKELASRLETVRDDKDAQFEIGIEHALQQCQELLKAGIPGLHLYVLNKSAAGRRLLDELTLPA